MNRNARHIRNGYLIDVAVSSAHKTLHSTHSVQCTVSSGLRRAQWSPFVPQVGTLRTLDTGTLALLIEPFQHQAPDLH